MTHRFKLSRLALAACVFLSLMSGTTSAQTAKPAAAKKPVATAPVATATLRISCDGDNAGAEVSINGAFKGECPLDIEVPAGTIIVKAIKKFNAVDSQKSEQTFRLGGDAVKRVEIQLRGKEYRVDAVARMDAEVEAMLSRKEAQQRTELPSLERAAQGGDATVMRRLGMVHKFGLAGPIDLKKSAYWYGLGAEAKDPASMFEFAMLLTTGGVVPADEAKRVELLRASAQAGEPRALLDVGRLIEAGEKGFQKNPEVALGYFETAAKAGIFFAGTSWWSLANDLKKADSKTLLKKSQEYDNIARARDLKVAESGEDFDAISSAAISLRGILIEQTDAENETGLRYARMTMRFKKKAAVNGDPRSLKALAREYAQGLFTPRDVPTAIRLYRQAAAQGDAEAAASLAKLEN